MSLVVHAVVDAVDRDGPCDVVEAMEEAVGAAGSAVFAGQVAALQFADAAGRLRDSLPTMKMFTLAAAAAITLAPLSIITAVPAQACVWDPAWFFLGQCNDPPPPPPLPPEQRQASRDNPNGIPTWWELDGVRHWCPPECLG
jgi:hypothetical protein